MTNAGLMPSPIFILSPALGFGPVASAMLGQHPQLYGLPDTHLFLAETLDEWWELCAAGAFGGSMMHGLLRTVAQLYFGEQTEKNVVLARAWLRRRQPFTTGYVLELLAERVRPRALVEKSSSTVLYPGSMRRAARMFPLAHFIHFVEHPRQHCEAVVAAIKDAVARHPNRVPHWLRQLACFSAANADEHSQERFEIDPQQAWHALNKNICDFLEAVPENQKVRVRVEDLVAETGVTLRTIAEWLDLRTDNAAIDAMKHPERSPYACFGPTGARYGDNPLFLRSPTLPAPPTNPDTLDAPMSWCEDDDGFSPEVRALARRFGYE